MEEDQSLPTRKRGASCCGLNMSWRKVTCAAEVEADEDDDDDEMPIQRDEVDKEDGAKHCQFGMMRDGTMYDKEEAEDSSDREDLEMDQPQESRLRPGLCSVCGVMESLQWRPLDRTVQIGYATTVASMARSTQLPRR